MAGTDPRVTACAFLEMPRRYTWEDYEALRVLVKDNELAGAILGREGYIVMRDLHWAVGALLLMEREAREHFKLPPHPGTEALRRK